MTTVYAPWNAGFGDQWACINLLLNLSDTINAPVRMHSPAHLRRTHLEILSALKYPTQRVSIDLTEDAPTEQLTGFDVWAAPFYPTKTTWDRRRAHSYVCYQFDGQSAAKEKNPSPDDERILRQWLSQSGFVPVRLGRHLSVTECVEAAASSAFFVGVCSGMSLIAHSVGLPVFLLEYRLPVVTAHRGKAYILSTSTEDFLRYKFPTWVDYLRFIQHPDGLSSTVPRNRVRRDAMADSGIKWWLP